MNNVLSETRKDVLSLYSRHQRVSCDHSSGPNA